MFRVSSRSSVDFNCWPALNVTLANVCPSVRPSAVRSVIISRKLLIVTMKPYTNIGTADSAAAFRSSPDAPLVSDSGFK